MIKILKVQHFFDVPIKNSFLDMIHYDQFQGIFGYALLQPIEEKLYCY